MIASKVPILFSIFILVSVDNLFCLVYSILVMNTTAMFFLHREHIGIFIGKLLQGMEN